MEAPETGRGEDGLLHDGWNRGDGVDAGALCRPGGPGRCPEGGFTVAGRREPRPRAAGRGCGTDWLIYNCLVVRGPQTRPAAPRLRRPRPGSGSGSGWRGPRGSGQGGPSDRGSGWSAFSTTPWRREPAPWNRSSGRAGSRGGRRRPGSRGPGRPRRADHVAGHVGEPRGLLIENEVAAVDGEAASVAEREQPLAEVLRESLCLHQLVEDESPPGLGEEFLEVLAPTWILRLGRENQRKPAWWSAEPTAS